MYLTKQLELDFRSEMEALVKKFKELSRLERSTTPISSFFPVSFILYCQGFSSWKRVMWDS
jgi:hypothetical protein